MTIWNERYNSEDFVFGKKPNRFFKQMIDELKPGKLLLPAEGEGRNAVYAAKEGWDVFAFDASSVGKDKAMQLADQEGVIIKYDVGLIEEFEAEPNEYDAIALIYCHMQPNTRTIFFSKLVDSLAPGGMVFMEAFRKEQLGLPSGGPSNAELLYSAEQLTSDFAGLSKLSIISETIWLDEGPGHQGEGKVLRLVGIK